MKHYKQYTMIETTNLLMNLLAGQHSPPPKHIHKPKQKDAKQKRNKTRFLANMTHLEVESELKTNLLYASDL